MIRIICITSLFLSSLAYAQSTKIERLYGEWEGIKMFQDQKAKQGVTYFLPNKGHMIIDPNYIHFYYYPYFKSAQFPCEITTKEIRYTVNDKQIKLSYDFNGDTLAFKMTYINKNFVKLFIPATFNKTVLTELDTYGFRANKLKKELELDTLLKDERIGFSSYDSIGFTPFNYLTFKDTNSLVINRDAEVSFKRGFNKLSFDYKGVAYTLGVQHLSGTQGIYLIPSSQCQCDSLAIHYMNVEWADRIRQAIIDEENF